MTLALQPDGKILLGGFFTVLAPNGGTSAARNHVARLNADGSLDSAYDPDADGIISTLALQPDGKLVVGGDFSMIGGQVRHAIARLNADGSVDAGFEPNADAYVQVLAVQADGRIVIGGGFTQLAPNGGTSSARNHIARLNVDGSVDGGFDPDANSVVFALALQPDGKLLAGGFFTSLSPNGGASITRNYLARLNGDGSADQSLDAHPNDAISALAQQSDGKLLVGGLFSSIGGIPRNHLARLDPDGSVDAMFKTAVDGPVYAILVQPDGKIVIAGLFSSVSPDGIASVARSDIARLNVDGSVDTAFNPSPNGPVLDLAQQPDGKLVIGGDFTSLSPNGGSSITRNRIARLNADGSVDSAFDPNADRTVDSVAMQSDGKILMGGLFSSLAPNGGSAVARNHIARVLADGSVDAAFDPDADGEVNALSVQPNGKILIAGYFTGLAPNGGSSVLRAYIARLDANGSVDTAFDPNADNVITALALQADGRVVIGGAFTSLAPDNTGSIARSYIARLDGDGSVDAGFDPNADDSVTALALQHDGKVVVGGAFTSIGGASRSHLARLSSAQAASQTLRIIGYSTGGSLVTWSRAGAGPELSRPPRLTFSVSGSSYTNIGTMQRAGSGWRFSGFVPPLNQTFFLRTQGLDSGGFQNGSRGLVESTLRTYLSSNDGIFIDGFQQ